MGSYNLIDDQRIENCIAEIRRSKGKRVVISDPKRSLDQNALMHSLIDIIAKELGNKPEELKLTLKVRWLGTYEKEVDGKTLVLPVETSTRTKAQISDFIDKLYALGANLNIRLPTPSHYGH